jgi:hypothetical protein
LHVVLPYRGPDVDHSHLRKSVVAPRPGSAMLTTRLSAVEALAPALALELAPVRVNAVTPALENDVKLDHIRQSIGHADPLTI